ncbi:MAG: carbon monoxide dehydrogenase subunit G [Bryobacterales bacterium]
MRVKGQHTVPGSQQRVWEALLDPNVLARTLPGCESLDPVGENQYKMRMKLAISSVQGLFDATVHLKDTQPPTSYRLELEGKGKIGFVKGGGAFQLEPEGENATIVHYEGDVNVGGMIAGVGQRLMDMTAKMLVKRFFSSLSQVLEEPRPGETA